MLFVDSMMSFIGNLMSFTEKLNLVLLFWVILNQEKREKISTNTVRKAMTIVFCVDKNVCCNDEVNFDRLNCQEQKNAPTKFGHSEGANSLIIFTLKLSKSNEKFTNYQNGERVFKTLYVSLHDGRGDVITE
jgi:hypothetical protein